MRTTKRRYFGLLAAILACTVLMGIPESAFAEKAGDKPEAKKAKKGKPKANKAGGKKAGGEKKAAATEASKPAGAAPAPKKKSDGMADMLKSVVKQLRKMDKVEVTKPVWNEKAGFGLPVPPEWEAKIDGAKVVLTSPETKAGRTTITLGPEPTELEASEFLAQLCKDLAEKQKVLPMQQPPMDVLDRTIYLAAFLDSSGPAPGFGAVLVMDRPGDQVFVIRVNTRDESLIKNPLVLASIAMLRFRGEPIPNFGALIGFGKTKPKLELGEIKVVVGKGTLAELRTPQVVRDMARKTEFKGTMHRYRMALATPKGYNRDRAWPVLIMDAPAEEEAIARYQKLADSRGVVVLAIAPQHEDTVWTADLQSRIYFGTLQALDNYMILDRSRVYLLASGDEAGKRAQEVAVQLPVARGLICEDTTVDGLTAALAKASDAKKRLAVAAVVAESNKEVPAAKVDALVAAWKKAGIETASAIKAASSDKAVEDAVDWLLKRDRDAAKANLAKLAGEAKRLAPSKPGEALMIYRQVAGSGLEAPEVAQARKAVTELVKTCMGALNEVTTQPAEIPADQVIAKYEIAQRYQGSPEGALLMYKLRSKLTAQ
ncbi:MAG: hypothetical protein JXQ73_32265 [Phycisphaerae bacterium]|nr:hypothetical protein [Phycisphaerae bacterium]